MIINAIIISFNPNCDSLLHNIRSYDKNVGEIIVVDNSSKSDSKNQIQEMCKKNGFLYHDMNGNKGIAVALNVGFQHAINNGAEWVLTMDQDSSFLTDLESYKSYIRNNDCSELLLLAPTYNYHNLSKIENRKSSNPILVPQSGNLVKLSNYIKIGPYKEDYFIDFVDYEYCFRARRNNLLLYQFNSELLNHESGIYTTTSFFGMKYNYFESSPVRYYFVVRNGLKTAIIYNSFRSFFIVIKTISRIIIIENDKAIKLKFVIKGFRDFFKSNYGNFSYYS